MSLTAEEETMDQKEAFLAAWRKFSPQGKPPDTEFLQYCGCDGNSSSNEQVMERIHSCNERLEHAINVIKSEGFVLKWLTEVLNVKDVNESESELDKVLNFFFPSTYFDALFRLHGKSADTAPTVATEDGTSFGYQSSKEMPDGENNILMDCCDLNEGRNKTISKVAEAGFSDEPENTLDGSHDGTSEFGFNNTLGMTGVNSGKLFSRENNQFDKEKSSLHDDNNTTEGNKLLANNNPEERDEHDVSQTFSNEERNPTGSESEEDESMEDVTHESDSREEEKPVGLKNRTLATVFSPLARGINKAKSKGKWHLPRSSSGSKHRRSDSRDSATSGEGDDLNFANHTESKTLEDLDTEVLLDTGEVQIKLNDICVTNQENMAADGGVCSDVNPPIDGYRDVVDFTRQGISENNEKKSQDIESEESRCEETNDDPHDVIIEVVDELISYLEGIEVVSSDEFEGEGESPHEDEPEGNDFIFGGVIRPRKPLRSRKQLDSVMSIGNVSVMSADSCVSPWSIDVAAYEMQSADSSAEEDNASGESRPSPEPSPGLPTVAPVKTLGGQSTPPPVRPPRRSKTERLSRTFESPKKLGAVNADDDEVFGIKGYEGRKTIFMSRLFHGQVCAPTIQTPYIKFHDFAEL